MFMKISLKINNDICTDRKISGCRMKDSQKKIKSKDDDLFLWKQNSKNCLKTKYQTNLIQKIGKESPDFSLGSVKFSSIIIAYLFSTIFFNIIFPRLKLMLSTISIFFNIVFTFFTGSMNICFTFIFWYWIIYFFLFFSILLCSFFANITSIY